MKTLSLLRHAKSSWDDPVQRDFDRPLNARGRRAAHTIGAWMAREGLMFDAIIASPAVRVRETLDQVAAGYGLAFSPRFERRIYMASATCLFDLLHGTDDSIGHLLLAGHNPGLEDLLLLATSDHDSPLRRTACEKYPTATFATLTFDVPHWALVDEGRAILQQFVRPRDLDPELGPEE